MTPDGTDPSAPASAPAVVLHIGAHKTASTHFQALCSANRDLLRASGCAWFGPDTLRHALKLPALHDSHMVMRWRGRHLRRALQGEIRAGQHLLVSDENMLGSPRPPAMVAGAQLYPGAEMRLAATCVALGLQGVTLALCIRNPLDWLVSGWGHQFLAGRPVSFERFCAGLSPLDLCWSEMVGRVLALEPVRHVVLWRHEDYGALAAHLPARFLGLGGMELQPLPAPRGGRRYLTGPSARAIAALPRIMAREPELKPSRAMRKAMRRFPKGADRPGPQPFAADQLSEARHRYQADWAQLAQSAHVTCLTP